MKHSLLLPPGARSLTQQQFFSFFFHFLLGVRSYFIMETLFLYATRIQRDVERLFYNFAVSGRQCNKLVCFLWMRLGKQAKEVWKRYWFFSKCMSHVLLTYRFHSCCFNAVKKHHCLWMTLQTFKNLSFWWQCYPLCGPPWFWKHHCLKNTWCKNFAFMEHYI